MENKSENKPKLDLFALKNLCRREVINAGLGNSEICGYSKKDLKDFVEKPRCYSTQLLSVIRFMYFNSGYFRRIIQYYVNLVKPECWTVDTEFRTLKAKGSKTEKFKNDYFNFIRKIGDYNFSAELPKILFNVFMYDACFVYIIKNDEGRQLFYFEPEDCVITGYANGIPCFAVKKPNYLRRDVRIYPREIDEILNNSGNNSKIGGYVNMPYEKTMCFKYNDSFDHLIPPFTFLIKEILDLEDFKELEKTKVENDIYKILCLKVPTAPDGTPLMNGNDNADYLELAADTVAKSIGILPTPFEVSPVEFTTNTSNNINNVQNAVDEMYGETGVSRSLFSGASSGSELKISVEIDASEVYRILEQVSRQINFHCRLDLPNNSNYRFKFRYLDITAFNQNDKIDELLKLAQASLPVKTELMAASGRNPLSMLGNSFMENDAFNLSSEWQPLQTSYTQSADGGENSEDNGRPEMDDTDISEITQNTRDNEGNDKDNRV